jgi:hypothetical protein
MDHEARTVFVRKHNNNEDLQNLSIIDLSIENVPVVAYYAQNVAEVKLASPQRFACDLMAVLSLLLRVCDLRVIRLQYLMSLLDHLNS